MGYFEDYRKRKHNSEDSHTAFKFIIIDLLQKQVVGTDKSRTITSLNMEQSSPSVFVPSMIYIMMYRNPSKMKFGNTEFYDAIPLFFCAQCTSTSVSGFNFNYMPNDVRAKFLDILSGTTFVEKKIDEGNSDFRVDEKLAVNLINDGVSKFIKFMKEQTGFNVSGCYRTYNRGNIIKSRMIEYDMWEYIPYLNFNDVVRGIPLANVQRQLINERNK